MKNILYILLLLASVNAIADNTEIKIHPRLGHNFGDIIEIEGTINTGEDTRMKADQGKVLLFIKKVNGKNTIRPMIIELRTFSFAGTVLPKRHTIVKLRGYETGSFTGIPKEAFKDIPSVSTTTHYFKSIFQVTKVLSN